MTVLPGSSLPWLGFLALLPCAAVESQSSGPAQVTERRIAPVAANDRVTRWTADHFVWLASSAGGSQLMLLLSGSNGKPANFRLIGAIAAQQGYRAIGLMYPDNLAVVAECVRDPDSACMARMRAEIIEGKEQSRHVDVDRVGATPAERYFGFRHARDQFRSISANWKALGLDAFGGVKDVDANTTGFGGAHVFTTDLRPATGRWEQAHPSVFGDGATPRRPDGTPVFDAVWRYLLGAP